MNDMKNKLKVLQDNYLTGNSESNEKEEICALKQKVKCLGIENKFLRNNVVKKQNLIDSLLEHNSNLLNHQCCWVIQGTQSNVRSGINTDVTDNHPNNQVLSVSLTNLSLMKKPRNKPPLIKER